MALLSQVDPGVFYINPWKLLPLLILVPVWARLLTWADKDSDTAHLPRVPVNFGIFGIGGLGIVLFFLIPNFWISLAILVVLTSGGLLGYVGLRSSQIGTKDLKKQFQAWLASFGKEKVVKEVVSELQLVNAKGALVPAPDDESPERPGYDAVQQLFVDPIKKNAERIQLAPAADGYKLSYIVDGFVYAGASPDKSTAIAAVDFTKKNAGLDLDEKRKPQKGKLKATTGGKKKELEVTTSGTSAGEAVDIAIDAKDHHKFRLDDLGLSDIQEAAIRDSIEVKQGIVLLSAPKQQGLTSLAYGILRAHDAFLSHIQTIERNADQDLEGITQNKLAAGAPGAEELKLAGWVVSQEPDVLMVTSIEEPATAKKLIEYAAAGKKVYVGIRAGSALDAIAVWRKWIGDDARAMRFLIMAISGRVVRKLCVQCKVGVTPAPEELKKMNLPADTMLFQERTEPMVDQKGNPVLCDTCLELRFKGRTGVYEVVIIDDEIKEAVLAGAGSSQVRTLVRKQRMPFLQEAALAAIQRGETSVKEVQRVFSALDSRSK
jgi:type II secretory ATPase GspE/PulE/Tfp pilus assembly ATPase PilB-like protein